jgi:hypothetical protein
MICTGEAIDRKGFFATDKTDRERRPAAPYPSGPSGVKSFVREARESFAFSGAFLEKAKILSVPSILSTSYFSSAARRMLSSAVVCSVCGRNPFQRL